MTLTPRQAIVCPAVVAVLTLLGACASTAKVTQGEQGATIAEAQAESRHGPKARITVGRIVDRSGEKGQKSLRAQIDFLRRRNRGFESIDVANVTGGMRDMLTTALFNSNRFIVLEREAISDVLVEQEFSAEGRVGDATRIPMGEIEGAELMVIGALTAFDAGASGGSLPIPIPLNRRGDVAILNLAFNRSYVAMDLRVIDVATSRIVATMAVESDATKFGAAVSGFVRSSGGSAIPLPVVLSGFSNTPVEKAISEMVDAAVEHLVSKTPPVYFRNEALPDGEGRKVLEPLSK